MIPSDPALVALIGLVALAVFATERFANHVVALAMLAALVVFRLVRPAEAFSGFTHTATINTAGFLILSEALVRTGAVSVLARILFRSTPAGRVLALMIFLAAFVSAWIANTALCALFIPIILEVAREKGILPSRLLLPLSHFIIIGGSSTVIGTSSHIFGASLFHTLSGGTIAFFDPMPFAAAFLLAASAYLLLFGWRHLPDRPALTGDADLDLREFLSQARILAGSPLIGKPALGEYLRETHDFEVVAVRRESVHHLKLTPELSLEEGDVLLLRGEPEAIAVLTGILKLEVEPELTIQKHAHAAGAVEYVEMIVGSGSHFAGHPVSDLNLQRRYGATVLAVYRRGRARRRRVNDILLSFGDVLLLQGPAGLGEKLARSREFVFRRSLDVPVERRRRMPVAIGILLVVLGLGISETVPMHVAAFLGAVAAVLTGCLTPSEMTRGMNLNILLLMGALIPFSLAFQGSGLADIVAREVVRFGNPLGPRGILMFMILAASALVHIVVPNGVVAVMLPVAVATAKMMGVSPQPFGLAVLFASAYVFATPFSYNTNAMVAQAAGYRFRDFLRSGLPLLIIFYILAFIMIPILYPFA